MRPAITLRVILLLIAVSIASASSGCGGSSDPAVAKIAGVTTITRSQFLHWQLIQAITQYKLNPNAPVPKAAISDSPSYAECSSFLARLPTPVVGPKQPPKTKTQALARCKQNHQQLKETTLKNLLLWNWLLGAGAALGFRPNEAEVKKQLKLTLSFLGLHERSPEQTLTDILFRAKVEVAERRLYEGSKAAIAKLPKTLTGKKREKVALEISERWISERRWASRTTCEPGYVMAGCSEYKEPGAAQPSS